MCRFLSQIIVQTQKHTKIDKLFGDNTYRIARIFAVSGIPLW
jgi:hypothetical protein